MPQHSRTPPPLPRDDRTLVDAALLAKHDRPGPRYTSYPTAVEFHDGVGGEEYRAALEGLGRSERPVSIYVHLPFCAARCLYCACNVVITGRSDVAGGYLDRLRDEVDRVADIVGRQRRAVQLHLGGGTPTYYPPGDLDQLVAFLRRRFAFDREAELSVEVDPRVTTPAHLEILARHGFRRLSVGVQDFDPTVQEAVRRVQSHEQTAQLVARARRLGFDSVNVDLIYGLPHQTEASFTRTIGQTLELRPDRLAVYSFAMVPWLKHHQKLLPHDAMPTGRDKLRLFAAARNRLVAAGYAAIGMDHFALPSDELATAQAAGALKRNFMGYATAPADDILGFGMSAIGFVGGGFFQNERKLKRYADAVGEGRLPVERGYLTDRDDAIRRDVIQSWMCNFRVDRRELERRHDIAFADYFREELERLAPLEREGLVVVDDDGLHAGRLGYVFPRNVAMEFDRHLRAKRALGPRFSKTV